MLSYKGAVVTNGDKPQVGEKADPHGKRQEKRPVSDGTDEAEYRRPQRDSRQYRHRAGGRYGGDGSRVNRNRDLHMGQERREVRLAQDLDDGIKQGTGSVVSMETGTEDNKDEALAPKTTSSKKVRKALFQTDVDIPTVHEEIFGATSLVVGDVGVYTNGIDLAMEVKVSVESDQEPLQDMRDAPMVVDDKATEDEVELGEFVEEQSNTWEHGENGAKEELMASVTGQLGLSDSILGPIWEDEEIMVFDTQVQEEAEGISEISSKPQRKKMVKGIPVLNGMSSKKCFVQALVSPRKKAGAKKEVQIGDGLYPGKSRKAPGPQGGAVLPKPPSD